MPLDRRTLLKGAGAAGAGLLAPGVGAADVDPSLDTGSEDRQEVIVVFRSREDVDRLGRLDLAAGYHKFRALPMGYARLTGEQIRRVAGWHETLNVERNREHRPLNDDAREVTGAETVQEELFYTGETVHAGVIDSGIDGTHPDFQNSLRSNYKFLNPLEGSDALWTDMGNTDNDTRGHGTHVSGSLAGEGTASDGEFRGMAPDADLTVYAVDAGFPLLQIVGAYDDMIAKQRAGRHDIQLVNNSYGATTGNDYTPFGALELATWEAFNEGMTVVFSAGNSDDIDTLNDYSLGPHMLCSAATDDEMYVTGFSSKGRKPESRGDKIVNYDRKAAFENLETLFGALEPPAEDRSERVTEISGSGTVGGTSIEAVLGADQAQSDVADTFTLVPSPDTSLADVDGYYVTATLSWTPSANEDLSEPSEFEFKLLDADGNVVDSRGSNFVNRFRGETSLTIALYFERPDAEAEYRLRVEASRGGGEYEVTGEVRAVNDEDIPVPTRPYGLYRPSVGTPGKMLMSALSPVDAWQGYAGLYYGYINPDPEKAVAEQSEQADEPYYGQLLGTSMSGPVLAGLVALVYDAYKQSHGQFPDPMEVIATVEATAKATRPDGTLEGDRWPHRTYTIGAGFADALAAVTLAEADDLYALDEYSDDTGRTIELAGTGDVETEFVYSVTGERRDAADAYTAGQTVRVDLTVDANARSTARDRIPFGWEVEAPDPDESELVDVYTEDGDRYIEISEVPSSAGEEKPPTVSYFLEAPEESGDYRFGPAEARPETREGSFQGFAGTDTNVVVGVDQTDG